MRLADVLVSTGIQMTDPEIEQLSAGFCSDDAGSISVTELCELIDEMLYKIVRGQLNKSKRNMQYSKTSLLNDESMVNMYQLLSQLCQEFVNLNLQPTEKRKNLSILSEHLIHIQKLLFVRVVL
jgi:hypothetical protein